MAGTILTNIGLSKLAAATPQNQLNITHIAVGDGNGGFPTLSPNATSLTNEVWRGDASNPIKDSSNSTYVYFETNIPPEVGPFDVREIACFDIDGDMIAVGHTSLIQKPNPTDDASFALAVKIFIALENASDFNLIYQNTEVTSHNSLVERDALGAHDQIYSRKIDSVKDLGDEALLSSLFQGQTVSLSSFWGVSVYDFGGGELYWDSLMPKSEHDGGIVIDPYKTTELGDAGVFNDYFTPSQSGLGCFVRLVDDLSLYISFFGAINDNGATDNYKPLNQAKISSNIDGGNVVLGPGGTGFSKTINLDTENTTIIGLNNQADQRGSALPSSYMVWNGGQEPMISSKSSYHKFIGFSVENRGGATSWLELNEGSIGNRYTGLDFVGGSGHTKFTESLIKSNGNRMGYSVFENCQFKGASNVYIYIDGQGSSNAITPITFKGRCIIESTNEETTFFKIIDEKVEALNVRDCTFNQQQAGLVIINCENSSPGSFDVINFDNNEIDINPSATDAEDRLFRIYNTPNININGNTMSLGGQALFMCNLVNSNVTSFNGNYYRSIAGPIFNPNSDSTVKEGVNYADKSNTNGVCKVKSAGITTIEYQTVMIVDGYQCQSKGGHLYEIEVSDSAGWQVRAPNTKPYYIRVGQFFSVMVKNATNGAISAGSFTNGFSIPSGIVEGPEPGETITYDFIFDGTEAIFLRKNGGSTETTSFTTHDGKTINVKNGLITSII